MKNGHAWGRFPSPVWQSDGKRAFQLCQKLFRNCRAAVVVEEKEIVVVEEKDIVVVEEKEIVVVVVEKEIDEPQSSDCPD